MFCNNCGSNISEEDNFCNSCGASLKTLKNQKSDVEKPLEKKVWYRILKVFYIFFYLCLFGGIIGTLYFGIFGDDSFLDSISEAFQALIIGYFVLELIRTALRYIILGRKPNNPVFIWILNFLKGIRSFF